MCHFAAMLGVAKERRDFPRFPFTLDVDLRMLAPAVSTTEPVKSVRGRTQNLSRGGLCILSEESLEGATVVICELSVPDLPVPIPILTNVRWSEYRNEGRNCYLYGLQFLH